MSKRHMPISALLRSAFLRGHSVRPSEFALVKDVSRQSVYKALAQFGAAVQDIDGEWHCVDRAALKDFTPPRTAYNAAKRAAANVRKWHEQVNAPSAWVALLSAWGLPLQPRDIDLPKIVHLMPEGRPGRYL